MLNICLFTLQPPSWPRNIDVKMSATQLVFSLLYSILGFLVIKFAPFIARSYADGSGDKQHAQASSQPKLMVNSNHSSP